MKTRKKSESCHPEKSIKTKEIVVRNKEKYTNPFVYLPTLSPTQKSMLDNHRDEEEN